MISNTILQDTLAGTKEITGADLTIVDGSGSLIASTLDVPEIVRADIKSFLESEKEEAAIRNDRLFRVRGEGTEEFVVILDEKQANAEIIGRMVAFQVRNLLVTYKEQFDKEDFVKNLLLDNLLYVDIYNRATKLDIPVDVRRVVMILESAESQDYSTLEAVKSVFAGSDRDFVTAIDESSIIVIKALEADDQEERLNEIGRSILAAVNGSSAHVAYGGTVNDIRDVSRSFKEARMALDVGKIFFVEQEIIAYSELGIGRLIYQLPIPLCKMFIKEIFKDKSPENFDSETTDTINKFFEHSLNVSETSRQLYIHRNTLVYRLDKLEKSTGLDLRVFDDAITFKIALMVVKYMKYMETLDY